MTCIGSHASTHTCAYYIFASNSWDPDAPLRRLNFCARQFDKWMKSWRCSKLYSTKPVMLLSPPPPLAAELGITWNEHYGGPFEIRQCSHILSNVDFLELYVRHLQFEQESAGGRASKSNHLLSKQPEARLNTDPIRHRLRCLHKVDKGIFGLTLTLSTWG